MGLSTQRVFSISFIILGFLIILAAFVFQTFLHPFLHIELHPLDENHLIVGSATALLAAFFVGVLYLHSRYLSKQVEEKEFELHNFYEDNAFFRLLANKSSDMVHLNDTTGKILYVNPVTYDLLDYTKDEIINRPAEYFIHPDDRENIRHDMRKVAQGEDIPPREIRLLQKSGSLLDVEVKGFHLNIKGEVTYIGAILRDISQQRQNRALLQVNDEWEKTFDSISDFISVHDENFRIVKANSALCELLGKSREEIIGKPCYRLFHNRSKPYDNCPHRKVASANHAVTEIIQDQHIGFSLQITCSPLFDKDGILKGSVHIARPYEGSNLKENEEALIPICAACKKIRNRDDSWVSPEEYFRKKHNTGFTHSICRECQEKLYPGFIRQ